LPGEDTRISRLERAVKASADRNRIRILRLLQKKRMCVCELAYVLGISQPSVSRHLKRLRSGGFIDSEREGPWTNYYLKPENSYAGLFLDNLPLWLESDKTAAIDWKKVEKADREILCGMNR